MRSTGLPRLFIILPLLVLVGACDKPKDNTQELGPPTTVEEISQMQYQSLQKLRPEQIRVGQTAHIIESQEVVTSQGPLMNLVTESVAQVMEKEDLGYAVILKINKKVIDHTEKDKPEYEFVDVLGFEKTKRYEVAQANDLHLSAQLFSSDSPAQKPATISITDVSFHNLQKREVVLAPPSKVSQSPDCRGLSPCSIQADYITYEIVFHMSNGSKTKHKVEWEISPKVPFFSSVLKQCASTIVPVDNVRVLVKQCQQVVDFSY